MSLDSKDMVKGRRVHSASSDEVRESHACKHANTVRSIEDMKEWDEATCPICMEHPHNAVLLKCSSYEKGCRPFMCNTSCRHSLCFYRFCKSSVPNSLAALLPEIPLRTSEDQSVTGQTNNYQSRLQPKLACPFCRGEIFGYIVIRPARQHMNNKVRICSTEACSFSGTYSELRKHARYEHPCARPREVEPTRQLDWVRESERGDVPNFGPFELMHEVQLPELDWMRLEAQTPMEVVYDYGPFETLHEVEPSHQLDWMRLESERERGVVRSSGPFELLPEVEPSHQIYGAWLELEREREAALSVAPFYTLPEPSQQLQSMRLESERERGFVRSSGPSEFLHDISPHHFDWMMLERKRGGGGVHSFDPLEFLYEVEPSHQLGWKRLAFEIGRELSLLDNLNSEIMNLLTRMIMMGRRRP